MTLPNIWLGWLLLRPPHLQAAPDLIKRPIEASSGQTMTFVTPGSSSFCSTRQRSFLKAWLFINSYSVRIVWFYIYDKYFGRPYARSTFFVYPLLPKPNIQMRHDWRKMLHLRYVVRSVDGVVPWRQLWRFILACRPGGSDTWWSSSLSTSYNLSLRSGPALVWYVRIFKIKMQNCFF